MGAFGIYKHAWNRRLQHMHEQVDQQDPRNDVVWVTKRYIPSDLRVSAPVQRHKPMAVSVRSLPRPEKHWVPTSEASLRAYQKENSKPMTYRFVSQPSTRCEEWSTLRQMLPSGGWPCSLRPPNWGTGYGPPPKTADKLQRRFPHINSPMTR